MVNVERVNSFEKQIRKIKNASSKERLKKQIRKILKNPQIGKPMKHNRKGTRELYVAPYRLSYAYLENEDKIIFLALYHKDEQ